MRGYFSQFYELKKIQKCFPKINKISQVLCRNCRPFCFLNFAQKKNRDYKFPTPKQWFLFFAKKVQKMNFVFLKI